ncbi:MAG: MOSC N-terminal beta barrel domain-containing protein, partial [Deltaproteobacteria bacterium]
MSALLAQIWRYPIKAIGAEKLDAVTLTAGQPLPGDRAWALAHDAAKLDPSATWFRKMNFLRGVAGPELMAITATTQGATLTLHHPRAGEITIDPASPEGDARLIAWISPLWPETRPKPHHLIHTGQAMTDNNAPWISILSLDSLRHLQGQMG